MNRRKAPRQKTALDPNEPETKSVAKLGPDIKAKIGQQLRIMYGEIVSQGVPDRFVDILRGLDSAADLATDKKAEGSKNEPP
jgi:hypothetical protein